MNSYGGIEKPLTREVPEAGELRLSPGERERLGLGEHSHEMLMQANGDLLTARWHATRGVLGSESLLEHLEATARIGMLVRLTREDGHLHLQLVERASTTFSGSLQASLHPVPAGSEPTPRQVRRTQLRAERFRLHDRQEYDWRDGVGLHRPSTQALTEQIEAGGWDAEHLLRLRLEAEELAALDDFSELLAVDVAKVEQFPYQEAAARTVLRRMRGRGILADEVGLGKTIEAGLILKELVLRGLASRVLIICPATLREQWGAELAEKFEEHFKTVGSSNDGFDGDRLIMSLHLARMNARFLSQRPWDLVIVDEAHHLASAGATKSRALIEGLDSRYLLFLTATPVQNDLMELYRLVTLLRPGTFTSARQFSRRFVDPTDPKKPVRTKELRALVRDVMVRTTRAQAGLDHVIRHTHDVPVTLSPVEHELYHHCVDTLRSVMTEPGDAQRRRALALRLTAAPRALAKTALKMADHHGNPRAERALREIGHLAADIPVTQRQAVALDRIQRWIGEHRKVLVFIQHTDTLEALLGLLEEWEVVAVPFHGGMAASAREASVSSFRGGHAAVMVSTDAGAEGRNLQFCNCVLNYDLPWNPMRIEQRIGRVHRVTQTRDVHVANLFAVGTIDESVYRLLHDKLAMFELLFGQVTTILGELDRGGDGGISFEGRVLQALTSRSDSDMHHRLEALGRELERARVRSQVMVASDAAISGWAADQTFAHRARLPRDGARELRPEQGQTARERQRRVRSLVRTFLDAVGARITHEEADHFLSAELPQELHADFGTNTLHLAFDREGLDHHPAAELCAVGSEVFEALLAALKLRGDLAGSLPVAPSISSEPVQSHAGNVTLLERTLAAPSGHRITAWVRAGMGEGSAERIEQVVVGSGPTGIVPRVPLAGGDPPPDGLSQARMVLRSLGTEVQLRLKPVLSALQRAAARSAAEERQRLLRHYDEELGAQRASQDREVVGRLERARAAAANLVAPTVELRAELLALRYEGGDDYQVVERWRHISGSEREIRYAYVPGDGAPALQADNGGTVEVLALCAEGHLADAERCAPCPSCSRDRCGACPGGLDLAPCAACGIGICLPCVQTQRGLCASCASPRRVEELDDDHRRAWRTERGVLLLVGERAVEIRCQQRVHQLVPAADVADPGRQRLRSYAAAHGLPLDLGLGGRARERAVSTSPLTVHWSAERGASWDVRPHGGTAFDRQLIDLVPSAGASPDVTAEEDSPFAAVLQRLRREAPPPPSPRLVGRLFHDVVRTELVATGLMVIHERQWSDGEVEHRTEEPVSFRVDGPGDGGVLAVARTGSVLAELLPLGRSYLVRVGTAAGTREWFVPAEDNPDPRAEFAWQEELRRRGLKGHIALHIDDPLPRPREDEFANPTAAELVERFVEAVWTVVGDSRGRPVQRRDLDAFGLEPGRRVWTAFFTSSAELLAGIEGLASPRPVHLRQHYRVTERWRGHAEARRSYEVRASDAPLPVLDDTGLPEAEFGVDHYGHLHAIGGSWLCPACERVSCRACGPDGALELCESCGQRACGRCRTGTVLPVREERCRRCGVRACGACSRDLQTAACGLCLRPVCPRCMVDGSCQTCANLRPASPHQIEALPPALAAQGAEVLLSCDPRSQVVVIRSPLRRECALLEGEKVVGWFSAGPLSDLRLRLLLDLRRRYGIDGDLAVIQGTVTPVTPLGSPHLLLHEHHATVLRWELAAGGDVLASGGQLARPEGQGSGDQWLDELRRLSWTPQLAAPSPAAACQSKALDALGPAAPRPAAGQLFLDPRATIDRLWFDDQGLHHEMGDTRRPEHKSAPLRPAPAPEWAAEVLGVTPTSTLSAALSGTTAVLLVVGEHIVLAVRHQANIRWHQVTDAPDELRRLRVGRGLLGRQVLCDVAAITDPALIQGPTLVAGRLLGRSVDPVITDSDAPADVNALVAAERLYGQWGPDAIWEEARPLRWDLRERLRRRVQREPGPERRVVALGARVQERWQVGNRLVSLRYELAPGEQRALLRCQATGEPVDTVHLDRSGHLVGAVGTCAYCQDSTCPLCPSPAEPCSVCRIAVCGICAASASVAAHLCPACSKLSRLKGRAARRTGMRERGMTELQQGRTRCTASSPGPRRVPGGYVAYTVAVSRCRWSESS